MPISDKTAAEIQDLAWALADEAISPDEAKRLEDMLLADADARKLYVQCMQLQADLHLFFNPKPPMIPTGTTPSGTPVLKGMPAAAPNSTPTSV